MKKNTLVWVLLLPSMLMAFYLVRTPISTKNLPTPIYNTNIFEPKSRRTPPPIFSDITLEAGIVVPHTQRSERLSGLHDSLGAGACAFDYNQDGWVDLLTLNGSGVTHFFGKPQWWQQNISSISLYRNNQGQGFTDETSSSGLIVSGWTMGCNTADLDNDGDRDIVISNYGKNQLWRNNGDGTFTDMSTNSAIQQDAWSTGVSFADVNQDGLLDIYITNYIDFVTNQLTFEKHTGFTDKLPKNFDATLFSGQKNQLLINQGNLRFFDKTDYYNVGNTQGRGLSSQWVDFNNDTYPDLIVFNDKGSQNKIYINDKGKKFSDATLHTNLGFTERMSDGLVKDFDQDGLADILGTTDGSSYLTVHRLIEDQGIRFKDVSHEIQLRQQVNANFVHWGASSADVNLDGWLDVVIANGHSVPDRDAASIPEGQKNTLLLNKQGHGFIDTQNALGPTTYNTLSSRCISNLDFNNDGAMDLYITNNNGLGQLLKNTIKDRAWIGFQLDVEPTLESGAEIIVEYQGRVIRRKTHSANYLCGHDPRWVIGLGPNARQAKVDKITVKWQGENVKSDFFNLKTNAYYVLSDKRPQAKPLVTSSSMDISSPLRVKKPDNQLTVIQWLIANNKTVLAKQALYELSNHNNTLIRLKTLELAQQLPRKQRVGFIQKALNDPESAIALAAIKYAHEEEDERLTRWLLKNIESNNIKRVCAASLAFKHFFDEEEAVVIHKYTALNPLIKVALSHQSPEAKVCAIEALGHSEHYRALTPLLTLSSHNIQIIRLAAVRALGLLKQKAAIGLLQTLFLDSQESSEVRSEALIAIAKIDPDYPGTILLERALNASLDNSTLGTYKQVIQSLTTAKPGRVFIHQTLTTFLDKHTSIFSEPNQSKKNTDIKKQKPESKDIDSRIKSLNKLKGEDYQSACEDIFSVNDELRIQALRSFRGCLAEDSLIRKTPAIIAWALQKKETELYGDLVKVLSDRKERWARDWIKQQIDQKSISLEKSLTLINNLPEKLSPSVVNQLITLYKQAEEEPLQTSLARLLIQHQQSFIKKDLWEKMNSAISKNEEDTTLKYAQVLIDISPDKVLNALVKSR